MANLSVRAASPGDEETVRALLHELAVYERLDTNFRLTAADVARDIIGPASPCRCAVAEMGGEAAGVATWFSIYDTFEASHSLYLEDLFVRPAHRGSGVGKALLGYLAERAREGGATHIEWQVLDWNEPAIAFYDKLRAKPVEGWRTYRLSGPMLDELR
jgi:diamine N-acetyltransferase